MTEEKSIAQQAREKGISINTVKYRRRHGWTLEEALNTPVNIKFRSKQKSIAQQAKEKGLSPSTVHGRLRKGWSLEKALNTPVQINKSYVEKYGKTLVQLCKEHHIDNGTVRERIKEQGMTLEEALKAPLQQGFKKFWKTDRENIIENQNKNRFRKKYVAISPDNVKIEITNLLDFCRDNKLNIKSLRRAIYKNKKYKGWTVKVKEND